MGRLPTWRRGPRRWRRGRGLRPYARWTSTWRSGRRCRTATPRARCLRRRRGSAPCWRSPTQSASTSRAAACATPPSSSASRGATRTGWASRPAAGARRRGPPGTPNPPGFTLSPPGTPSQPGTRTAPGIRTLPIRTLPGPREGGAAGEGSGCTGTSSAASGRTRGCAAGGSSAPSSSSPPALTWRSSSPWPASRGRCTSTSARRR
mmetsp:Transcript_33554/g.106758  ORF Transcript_33554/g.106758 Transcript_33554/m.106758 type:complete len:206 (+) Transcript_33554:127-744(+)